MQENLLTIGKDTAVIITGEDGKPKEGTIINHDHDANKYVVKMGGSNEFWSPEFVKRK
jgi:hypothetical protein